MAGFWKGFIGGVGGAGDYMKLTHNVDKLSKLIASYSLAYGRGEYSYDEAVFNVQLYAYYVRTLVLDKIEELELEPDKEIFVNKESNKKLPVNTVTELLVKLIFQLAREIDTDLNDDITNILQKGNIYHNIDISNDSNFCKALGLKI